MSIAALSCAGCSETATQTLSGMSLSNVPTASLQQPGSAAGRSASTADTDADSLRNGQRTMASKVMAAMALERVTGRKPDPGRLVEAN